MQPNNDFDLVFISQGDKIVKEWFGAGTLSSSSAVSKDQGATTQHVTRTEDKEEAKLLEHQRAEQKRQLEKLHQQLRERHGRQGLGTGSAAGKATQQKTGSGRAVETSSQLQMLQNRMRNDARKRGDTEGDNTKKKPRFQVTQNSRPNDDTMADDSTDSEEESRYTAIAKKTEYVRDVDDIKASIISEAKINPPKKKRKKKKKHNNKV